MTEGKRFEEGEVRLQPSAPDKELPFVVINFFHFASDEEVKKYEAEVAKWWPNLHLFIGPISGDVSGKYTHCIIWTFKDFDELKRNHEDYALTLDDSERPGGDFPGYAYDQMYACRVVDHRDPVMLKHGLDGWEKRMYEVVAQQKSHNPERVARWTDWISQKITAEWGEVDFVTDANPPILQRK